MRRTFQKSIKLYIKTKCLNSVHHRRILEFELMNLLLDPYVSKVEVHMKAVKIIDLATIDLLGSAVRKFKESGRSLILIDWKNACQSPTTLGRMSRIVLSV